MTKTRFPQMAPAFLKLLRMDKLQPVNYSRYSGNLGLPMVAITDDQMSEFAPLFWHHLFSCSYFPKVAAFILLTMIT